MSNQRQLIIEKLAKEAICIKQILKIFNIIGSVTITLLFSLSLYFAIQYLKLNLPVVTLYQDAPLAINKVELYIVLANTALAIFAKVFVKVVGYKFGI